jgi:hypothetical protein
LFRAKKLVCIQEIRLKPISWRETRFAGENDRTKEDQFVSNQFLGCKPICWSPTNSMEEQGVLAVGAWWLGRKHLTVAEFRNHYGVYPRTVRHVAAHVVPELEMSWLLKSLWWMKQYPTEEVIKNHGSSPAHFRNRLWPCLDLLKSKLPEVCPLSVFFVLTLSRSYRSTCAGF